MTKVKIKYTVLINIVLWIVLIILVNYIGSFIFMRLDLTEEKRYTLSDDTKEYLENLNDIVFYRIYLEGDLNAGLQRLQNSTKEMLNEFRAYAGDNIQYEFADPFKGKSDREIAGIGKQLMNKGLVPTSVKEKNESGKVSQNVIFPGAIVSFNGREEAVNILDSDMSKHPEQNLNNSIQDLEYKLMKSVYAVMKNHKPTIAFTAGNGELSEVWTRDITKSLSEYYKVERIEINGKLNSLQERRQFDSTTTRLVNKYDAIIIAKPDSIFSKYDKYIIDQYIMNGGKVLWMLEGTTMDMDSLQTSNASMAMIKKNNINDQIFKYGARVNSTLLQDLQSAKIPVNTAVTGREPQFKPVPWLYFPLLSAESNHPVTRNLGLIKSEFISSVDTVGQNPDVKKEVLLKTSNYTKELAAPVRVSLDIVGQKPEKRFFTKKNVPVAVLLEGKFESVFKNRLDPKFESNSLLKFMEESKPTKMIVVGDGDIIKNPIINRGGRIMALPLGSDKWFQDVYYSGNKNFILNSVNYLTDDSGLMDLRSKDVKLRILDKTKIKDNKFKWQLINVIVPVIFIVLIGLVLAFIRKRKYLKK